ncbi:peptidase S8/S53 domain-containing protein [Lasiosphaeria ovina]|uniref:Peptidase S8/S53 domain-containing protein n=1 Tax=Lasiosphaeria ovina TaxID=92902 RepID=A0AAE0KIP0_9PEZI|nr:peptidase S8/S53 domain-containing protein [Lasiosphaeria ovina]
MQFWGRTTLAAVAGAACVLQPVLAALALLPSDTETDTVAHARGVPSSSSNTHYLHERHEPAHVDGWARRERVDAGTTLPMRVGLRQSNLDAGHELLMNISDPESPRYGKHLSAKDVTAMFAPSVESVDAVKSWLVESGIPAHRLSQSTNKQWIQFDALVGEAERLLLAKYHVFEHLESGVTNIACSEYHIPTSVAEHVDYITPGTKLVSAGYGAQATERMRRRRRTRQRRAVRRRKPKKPRAESDIAHVECIDEEREFKILGSCGYDVTPTCVRNQYQIPNGTTATPGNELGVFQGLNQHYNQWDLDMYWKHTASWIPQGTHPELRAINGAYGPIENVTLAGDEADLDFQVAIPLIWPQTAVLYQADDEWYQQEQLKSNTRYAGFFNTFFDAIDGSYCTLDAFGQEGNCNDDACRDPEYPNPNDADDGYQGELMCGEYEPTNVISISYSGVESALPYGYMQRQCFEIMKLALQGVTVVESSGDNGVGGRRYDPRAGCLGPNRDVFSPRLMSNCPYILSVGATELVSDNRTARPGNSGNGNNNAPEAKFVERATTYFASGGGFSNVFETPRWQARHVERYLARANMSHLGYEGGGRNYSNVGAQPGRLFNRAGRGYPDVAAIGDNYRVVTRGSADRLGGTSVAVPIWASILTLVNEARLAAGKSTVGFVHQVLYKHPEVFNDITKGSNPGCGGDGFRVEEGWDPVTGLGTPIYPKLLDLFMSLP